MAGTSVGPDGGGVYRPQITHKSERTGTITQEPQHLWLHDLNLGVETAVMAPWHPCGGYTALQCRTVDNGVKGRNTFHKNIEHYHFAE